MIKVTILPVILFLCLIATNLFSKPLHIVAGDFPPYVYKEGDQVKGFNVELLKEIFKRMNLDFYIEIYPWARALRMIEQGSAEAMFPLFKTEERLIFTDYSAPFTTEDTALFVMKNRAIEFGQSLDELSGYTFGRVRGYSSGYKLDKLIKDGSIRVEKANDSKSNLMKLLHGRIDILIEARYVALYELKKANQLDNVEMLAIVNENISYLGFSKIRENRKLISEFNSTLQDIKKDGTYEQIVNKFFYESVLRK